MAQNQSAQATEGKSSRTAQPGDTNDDQAIRDREHDLEAEQESAEAMDADVPQPPDASETTEGQPS